MRLCVLALLMASAPCLAQWVEFDACGRGDIDVDNLPPKFEFQAEYIRSPNIGTYRFRADKISVMKTPRASETVPISGIDCIELHVEGEPYLVVGTPEEASEKIRKALEEN